MTYRDVGLAGLMPQLGCPVPVKVRTNEQTCRGTYPESVSFQVPCTRRETYRQSPGCNTQTNREHTVKSTQSHRSFIWVTSWAFALNSKHSAQNPVKEKSFEKFGLVFHFQRAVPTASMTRST